MRPVCGVETPHNHSWAAVFQPGKYPPPNWMNPLVDKEDIAPYREANSLARCTTVWYAWYRALELPQARYLYKRPFLGVPALQLLHKPSEAEDIASRFDLFTAHVLRDDGQAQVAYWRRLDDQAIIIVPAGLSLAHLAWCPELAMLILFDQDGPFIPDPLVGAGQ